MQSHQAKAYACLLEGVHLGDDIFDIQHQHAFGQFELEPLWVGTGGLQRGQHLSDKIVVMNLAGADVDRQREVCFVRVCRPSRQLHTGGGEYPMAERQESARFPLPQE